METELLTVRQSEEMQKTNGNPSPFSEAEYTQHLINVEYLLRRIEEDKENN